MQDINNSLKKFLKKKPFLSSSPNHRTLTYTKSTKNMNNQAIDTKTFDNQTLNLQTQQRKQSISNWTNNQQQETPSFKLYPRNPNKQKAKGSIRRNTLNPELLPKNQTQKYQQFQLAKLTSQQCLDTLLTQLQQQIKHTNNKIEYLQSNLISALNEQLVTVHKQMLSLIESIFEENLTKFKGYIERQSQVFIGELVQLKQQLDDQYNRVFDMRKQMEKGSWRKIAGQLFKQPLQENIEELLALSESTEIPNIQKGEIINRDKIEWIQWELNKLLELNMYLDW